MSGTTNVPSCYVLLRRGRKILFVLRENTGYMDGCYGLPAGQVEDKESFRQAAVREVLEEVGVKVQIEDLKHVHTMHRISTDSIRVDIFFETKRWQGEPINAEPDKHSKIIWFDINDLPSTVMDYTKTAIENSQKSGVYSEFGWN